jgi:hypothetical protein
MASLAERLVEVADQLTDIETKWSFSGVPDANIAKVAFWRDVVLEAAYALNTGPHKVVANPQEPRIIGVRAMENKLSEMRWGLTPREYQEYARTGTLYNSIMDSILDALGEGGYDIVKHG